MIAPLLKTVRGNAYMLGDIQGCGVTDFIYLKEATEEQLAKALSLVINNCNQLYLGRLKSTSPIYKFCAHHLDDSNVTTDTLVEIHFGNNYNEYFSGLSKHVRQNLRTSYNRLQTDNLSYSLQIIKKRQMNSQIWKEVNDIYCTRQIENYGAEKGLRLKNSIFKHDSLSLRYNENLFAAILYYNQVISAVFMGLIDNNGNRIVVPRLAINNEYSRYSPGNQLINEAIKYLIENTNVRTLDLSRGTEKYKYMMGGTEYFTKNFLMLPNSI